MPRRINKYNCIGCDSCERVCKIGCITKLEEKRILNESVCVD
ncbi:4Fe-4S binding protein [Clostridioides sp. GD02404]|nr:4Fe-4S binding protein [Clostridioides difficile]NJK16004.1 4Fe-4S binding protein [Clostridioides difficile]